MNYVHNLKVFNVNIFFKNVEMSLFFFFFLRPLLNIQIYKKIYYIINKVYFLVLEIP